jgi:site-specific DNA recombinase
LGLWEASRGSRDLGEWVRLLDLCRARGTRIWVFTHRRIYDLSLRRDWRTLAEEGIDAVNESEKIAERTRRGKRMAAAAGRPAGKLVYGFVRDYDERGRFVQQVAHPKQAPILREMVDGLYDGQSLNEVARRLAARGVLTANGAAWTAVQIRQTVLNPSYIGKRVHQGVVVGDAV